MADVSTLSEHATAEAAAREPGRDRGLIGRRRRELARLLTTSCTAAFERGTFELLLFCGPSRTGMLPMTLAVSFVHAGAALSSDEIAHSIISSVWCAVVSVIATLPALAWSRPSRHRIAGPSVNMTMATDKGAVVLWWADGCLGVRDAVGVQTRFHLDVPESGRQRLNTLTHFGFVRDDSVALFDRTRQPRVLARASRQQAFDLLSLTTFLESAGLMETELTKDDLERSRDLTPVGGVFAGRHAVSGSGPWRAPTLATALPAAFFIGAIALPLAVGLVDSLGAAPIWAVLAIASTALFIGTYVAIAAWALWQDRRR